jgi:hypothetical protein
MADERKTGRPEKSSHDTKKSPERRSPDETTKNASDLRVGKAIQKAEKDTFGAKPPVQAERAEFADIHPGTYSELRNGKRRASLEHLVKLSKSHGKPLAHMLDGAPDLYDSDGIRWRLVTEGRDARQAELLAAAHGVLCGLSLAEIQEVIRTQQAGRGRSPSAPDEGRVLSMAQGGAALGLVEFSLSPDVRELVNPALSELLERALELDSGRKTAVHVVRNVCHDDFKHDPLAPVFIALRAHVIVAEFFGSHNSVFTIGLAGGAHCEQFVTMVGSQSCPIPQESGDRRLTFVPLTLEPFTNHDQPIANRVVGEMVTRCAYLIGRPRVSAPSLQSFGYVVNGVVGQPERASLETVREQYDRLDAIVCGCGDREPNGWLDLALIKVGMSDPDIATDAMFNLLTVDGKQRPLEGGRSFVGLSLLSAQRLARSPNKLALLLTSGTSKGLPLVAVNRSGAVNTIVCDERAALAALEGLGKPLPGSWNGPGAEVDGSVDAAP